MKTRLTQRPFIIQSEFLWYNSNAIAAQSNDTLTIYNIGQNFKILYKYAFNVRCYKLNDKQGFSYIASLNNKK